MKKRFCDGQAGGRRGFDFYTDLQFYSEVDKMLHTSKQEGGHF